MGHRSIVRGSRAKGERFSYRGGKRIAEKWGKLFWCPVCHYEAHADFNGSANVHRSFYREWHSLAAASRQGTASTSCGRRNVSLSRPLRRTASRGRSLWRDTPLKQARPAGG